MKINQLFESIDITQTSAFKKWFGNSKIVDSNGKPLKVYHGTTANFDAFTPALGGAVGGGIYLATDPDDAAKYIDRGSGRVDAEGGHIIPLYASIKNPLLINVVKIQGSEHCIINGEPYRYREIPKDFANGHDGLIIHYKWEEYDNINIVAFSPNQVKSIHNNGAFSNSPNILESTSNKMETNHLFEARGDVWVPKGGDLAVSIVLNSRSNPPTLFMFASDEQPIKDSKNIVVLKVNSPKFKELRYGRYHNLPYLDSSHNTTQVYNNLSRLIDRPELLANPEDFAKFVTSYNEYQEALQKDGVFKSYTFTGVTQLAKALLTTFKMHTNVVNKATGIDINQADDLVHQKIGNTELIFPDNMRGKRIQEITKLITEGNRVIEQAGLGVLTKVRMIVAPIQGNFVGLYYPTTKNIKIDPAAKATKTALKTILHEYGHKWYFEQLSPQGKQAVYNQYMAISKNIPQKQISPERAKELTQYAMNVKSLLQTIKTGDEIGYIGKNKKYKDAAPYRVIYNTIQELSIISQVRNTYKLTGKSQAFINSGFTHNGKPMTVEHPPGSTETEIEAGWFPTEYSRKNNEEWYAELFAYYLMGKLKDQEVIDFIKSTLNTQGE